MGAVLASIYLAGDALFIPFVEITLWPGIFTGIGVHEHYKHKHHHEDIAAIMAGLNRDSLTPLLDKIRNDDPLRPRARWVSVSRRRDD